MTHTLTGLTNGLRYAFQVRARSLGAVGPASDIVTATPRGLPAKPTGLVAQSGENAAATLTWPTSNTAFQWSYSKDNGTSWSPITPTTVGWNHTYRATGLTNGDQYTFKVRGLNRNGQAGAGLRRRGRHAEAGSRARRASPPRRAAARWPSRGPTQRTRTSSATSTA